ncbi:DUF3515 domain-containing protein [Kitasatospora sp. NBC_00315]|uniref:DUF3515 domain-containing protein n=1 Tax=Kitasatospora sp. NBC_00315 TaxID=2975963 RepID=UPI00324D21B7
MTRADRVPRALKALPAPLRWLSAPVALLGCVALLVGNWGAPAQPAAPTPRASELPYCEAFARALPQSLLGRARTPTDSPFVAVWNSSPRTVVRCGVPRPDGLNGPRALDSAPEVNGVQWFDEPDGEGGYRFTTVLRYANVEVTVPAGAYPNYADPLPSVSDVVAATVPIWGEKAGAATASASAAP